MKPTLKTSFTSYKPLAIISGPFFHHLDHLAPLCHFLNCPLFVDDPLTFELGQKFYPKVDLRFENIDLSMVAKKFNLIIVSTKHAKDDLQALFFALNIFHMRFCYCPHGQSDKGYFDQTVQQERNQDICLFYGERQKKIIDPKDNFFVVGNFRKAYFEKFKKKLTKLIENELKQLPKQKNILYAPTWSDQETSTTFFHTWKELIELLPDNYNLIIKLHPLLEKHHPANTYEALSYNQCKPNVLLLYEMPLIYPLLNKIDIYLGDYSAIGYDFLFFNKPLFFLGEKNVPLHACGEKVVSPSDFFSKLDNSHALFEEKKTKEYHYTFSPFVV